MSDLMNANVMTLVFNQDRLWERVSDKKTANLLYKK